MESSFLVNNLTTTLQILGLVCILLVAVYGIYNFFKKRPSITILNNGPLYLVDDAQLKITSEKVMKSINGTEYTIGFWLYNRNPPENANWKNKYDTVKGVINHELSPTVFFYPPSSELNVHMGYLDEEEILQYERIVLPVKKQHWQHYLITVKDQVIDFYVNGVLEKSTRLKYQPYFSRKSLFVGERGNQSLLTLANLSWTNKWIDTQQARTIFEQQRNTNAVIREPDTYVEQLHKRFS